jgi:microcystin-dependent protein
MALPPTIPNNTIVSNISGQAAAPAANTLSQLLNAILGTTGGGRIITNHANTWTTLAPGSIHDVLQIRGDEPAWGPLSLVLDSMGQVQGSIMFRGLNSWTTLPPGAPGSFLQTQGATAPQWAQPVSLVPTGALMPFIGADAKVPSGWVLASGGTIGDASSGATTRANVDTVALWVLLYTSWPDAQAPVSGGRRTNSTNDAVNAVADFNAHKTIRLPDLRGRVAAGKDDMGGTAAGRLTAAGSGVTGTALGAAGGAETHRLTGGQMPQHSHHITDPGHVHAVPTRGDLVNTGRAGAHAAGTGAPGQTQSATTGITIDNSGGSEAHNNTPPTIVVNYIIKL